MLDAYTVRKAIPRIVVAVIAINLSIYLCVAALDIATIVGRGIGQILVSAFVEPGNFKGTTIEFNIENNILGVLGVGGIGVLIAKLIAGGSGAAGALLGLLLPLVVTAALTALAILFTLVIWQALVIFLTVISPIAIACYILPGTEKYFKQWWDLYFRTLLVYPIIAVLFAMGNVMGSILLGASSSSPDGIGTIQLVAAVLVIFAPLVLIPFAFKLAGGAIASVMNLAQGRAANLAGTTNKRIEASKRDPNTMLGNLERKRESRRIQNRARWADSLKARSSKSSGLRSRMLRGAASAVGGVNIEARASARRAEMGKYTNDIIATGRDDEVRGLTVDRSAVNDSNTRTWNSNTNSWVGASEQDALMQVTSDGTRQYKTLGGAWVDESHVIAGQNRWGNDQFVQQAALSYEMRKAQTDEQIAGVSSRYRDLAVNQWGMSEGEAQGSWIGAAFENQNQHLEYKYTDALTGKLKNGGKDFAQEVYEKRGTYALSQMSAHTIDQLREAHRVGDADTKRMVESTAESFMARYGGGGGQVGEVDGVPIEDQAAPLRATGRQAEGGEVFRANSQGSAHVAEAVRKLAVEVGVYRPLDPSTDTQSARDATKDMPRHG